MTKFIKVTTENQKKFSPYQSTFHSPLIGAFLIIETENVPSVRNEYVYFAIVTDGLMSDSFHDMQTIHQHCIDCELYSYHKEEYLPATKNDGYYNCNRWSIDQKLLKTKTKQQIN